MFCGQERKTTREHIFGASVAKNFPPVEILVDRTAQRIINPRTLEKGPLRKALAKGGGDHALAITSFSMCKDCNERNGREISEISKKIVLLFKRAVSGVLEKDSRLIHRYFQRIGLLVDLETCAYDSAIMTQDRREIEENAIHHRGGPIVGEAERRSFIDGDMANSVSVHLSRYDLQHGRQYPMTVARSSIYPNLNQPCAKRFIFAIERLAVMVSIGSPVFDRTERMTPLPQSSKHTKIPSLPKMRWDNLTINASSYDWNLDGSSTRIR